MSTPIPSLIFLNRFFYPDHSATSQMLSDLALDLAKDGRRVTVITSRQRYDAPDVRLAAQEVVSGVEIHRVWTSRFGRSNLLGRSVDYATFYLAAAWRLWRLARRGDVVVAKTDPPMLSVLAAPICRWRGARLVNWLQDLFPEVADALGVGSSRPSSFIFGTFKYIRDRSLRAAACNVVIGELMADRLRRLHTAPRRIEVIPNWADGSMIRPVSPIANVLRAEWGLGGRFVVGYSGNLGRAHDIATLLGAISSIERQRQANGAPAGSGGSAGDPQPDITWLFIGGGAQYEALRREVVSRNLASVQFRPYQPRERLSESLSAADVHIVTLRPELEGLIVPSKFYGIAAAGRATVFIGSPEGEIASLLDRHQCGLSVAEGDSEGLAQAILKLAADRSLCQSMGTNARCMLERHYDKSIAIARWQRLLDEIGARPS